jgi:xylulose-5-phosphate/fructose-6-phosphate phosphoketolase
MNRLINKYDLDAIFLAGPGHGAPGVLAPVYLEGTYAEIYPNKGEDVDGMREFFKEFSFPGGIGSHCTPETPGSIHEGGELGYSLSHAFGAAFDNPDLVVTVMVGDGESETGPLATAWHSNKFLNPVRDGAVLPVLHLNGYKINNPTILARISHEELDALFRGYGWTPHFVEGDDPATMHQLMAATMETCVQDIRRIQAAARKSGKAVRARWPMIVLRSPKGWTGPKKVAGKTVEGYWRAHQVPMADVRDNPENLKLLEKWLKGYKPQELFDANGRLVDELKALAPKGRRRMSANPHANGGLLRRALRLPDFRDYAVPVKKPGTTEVENTRKLGEFLRDILKLNLDNFRVFGPDETSSNKLDAVYQASKKTWLADMLPVDADGGELSPDGRVMEMLSEHTLEGWLEGYLLTGRHGFFSTYEAFVHVIDSMFNQHAKWLDICEDLPWRAPVASLNMLITSTVWRQDHNGFTHQDPGFLDVVVNKSPRVTRIYLPPDSNCLMSVANHCLKSTDDINVIVCDKQKHLQFLDMDAAIKHCTKGIGIWDWASNDQGAEPDVVMAACGDIATQEALAAVALLRQHFPDLKIRFVNVVDLYRLTPPKEHPHGLSDRDFDTLFTTDKPIIFNFHGYPWLIHRLSYRRTNHRNLHVRGYKEKGNINTPLELAINNEVDRFSLAIDAIDRVPRLQVAGAHVKEKLRNLQIECRNWAHEHGIDRDAERNWKWPL